jgi:peptidoglycan/LPS O-acetylase OafA/YrhL
VEYVAICLVSGVWTGYIGRSKGSYFWMWFVIGAVFPLLGLFAALLYRYESDELRRQCPTCGKIVKLHDQICTRCGTELEFPDVAIESETSANAA